MKSLRAILPFTLLVSAVVSLPLAGTAHALDQALFVNTFSDSVDQTPGDHRCKDENGLCTLRAAIMEANALGGGGTSITLTQPGTYTLTIKGAGEDDAATGDLDIKTTITLWAPSGGPTATIAAQSGFGDRVLDIPAGTPSISVQLEPNLVITGGVAPSGEDGGGVRSLNAGYLNFNQMTVSGNRARNGGGVFATGPSTSGFNVNVSNFSGNTATMNGGGLDIEGNLNATLGFLTAQDNHAANGGGLAAFQNAGSTGNAVTSGSGLFTGNVATSSGGGMIVSRFAATMIDVTSNTAANGGGVAIVGTNGPSNIGGRNQVLDNSATGKGGGVYGNCVQTCGVLALTTIENNTSGSDGGGVYVTGGLALDRSLVDNNRAGGTNNGGAVFHNGSLPLTMTNTTVTGNFSSATGSPRSGGVVDKATVADVYTNDTIAWNTGGTANGVVVTGTGAVAPQLKNTIVADTVTRTALCTKALTSLGHNMDSGNTCGLHSAGDMVNTDPGLNPLSDNGGGVYTLGLKTGTPSVAIDAGDNNGCPATDARWVKRSQDGDGNGSFVCDMGAYEVGPSFVNSQVGMTSTPSTATPHPGDTVTYTLNFTNSGPFATINSIVSNVLPSQLTPVSCVIPGIVCSIVGQLVTIVIPKLGLSNLPTVTIKAKVGSGVAVGTVITNIALTWADNPDPNDANNVGLAKVTVS